MPEPQDTPSPQMSAWRLVAQDADQETTVHLLTMPRDAFKSYGLSVASGNLLGEWAKTAMPGDLLRTERGTLFVCCAEDSSYNAITISTISSLTPQTPRKIGLQPIAKPEEPFPLEEEKAPPAPRRKPKF